MIYDFLSPHTLQTCLSVFLCLCLLTNKYLATGTKRRYTCLFKLKLIYESFKFNMKCTTVHTSILKAKPYTESIVPEKISILC